jgi:hypothetical protein
MAVRRRGRKAKPALLRRSRRRTDADRRPPFGFPSPGAQPPRHSTHIPPSMHEECRNNWASGRWKRMGSLFPPEGTSLRQWRAMALPRGRSAKECANYGGPHWGAVHSQETLHRVLFPNRTDTHRGGGSHRELAMPWGNTSVRLGCLGKCPPPGFLIGPAASVHRACR